MIGNSFVGVSAGQSFVVQQSGEPMITPSKVLQRVNSSDKLTEQEQKSVVAESLPEKGEDFADELQGLGKVDLRRNGGDVMVGTASLTIKEDTHSLPGSLIE